MEEVQAATETVSLETAHYGGEGDKQLSHLPFSHTWTNACEMYSLTLSYILEPAQFVTFTHSCSHEDGNNSCTCEGRNPQVFTPS